MQSHNFVEMFGQPFEVIDVYTRAQAIEDGVLVDVSNVAKEAGFIVSVAVTSRVFHEVIVPPEETATTQDDIGRLWDLLNVLRMEIRRGKPGRDRIDFYFLVQNKPGKLSRQPLKALCHPGDNREPVITVMFPDED
jgi:hypothetical protein